MDWCNCSSAAGVKAGAEQIIQVVLVKGACRWCLVYRWFQYQGLPICSPYFHAVYVVASAHEQCLMIWAILWWSSGIGVSAFLSVCCFGVFIMRKHGEEPSSCCVFFYLIWYRPVERWCAADSCCVFIYVIYGTDQSRDDVQRLYVSCIYHWAIS